MERLCELEKDDYCDDYSDGFNATDSSDDDIEQILDEFVTTPADAMMSGQQKISKVGNTNDAGNMHDFEVEMNEQLSSSFQSRQNDWLTKMRLAKSSINRIAKIGDEESDGFVPSTSHMLSRSEPSQYELDDEGRECKATDSDDEFYEHEKSTLKEYGRSNEELFYDPDSDKNDQHWVDEQRSICHAGQKNKKLNKSDAMLNCPACMTTLCYDCQRHEIYKTQYRAMFVLNCEVSEDEVLFVPREKTEKKLKVRNKPKNTLDVIEEERPEDSSPKLRQRQLIDGKSVTAYDPNDLFKPVRCLKCKTEVAVYDNEDVYHFFYVLSGYV